MGTLTFDSRPGMEYAARVADVPQGKGYVGQHFEGITISGTFTVRLTCDDPLARMDRISVADEAE